MSLFPNYVFGNEVVIQIYMLSKTELLYVLALQRVSNLGDISAKKLIQAVGSAEGIFKEKRTHLLKIHGIGSLKLKYLNERDCLSEAESELDFIETNGIKCFYFLDKGYPEKLKHCMDGPILLFQSGNVDLQNKKIISIVGTRKITTYGTTFCNQLVEQLAPLDPVIVSGFAYGVDITAQRAAMEHGLQTVRCIAHL